MTLKLVASANVEIVGRKPVCQGEGCTMYPMGLGAFAVTLPPGQYFTLVKCGFPTHTSTIVKVSDTEIHIILHTPEGKRHIPPLCPLDITIYKNV